MTLMEEVDMKTKRLEGVLTKGPELLLHEIKIIKVWALREQWQYKKSKMEENLRWI